MRKYDDEQERTIRVARLVEDWTRSGLLDATQRERLLPDLQVDLRRTNLFLRLTLFGFGLLIIAAAVGLVGVTLGLNTEIEVGTLFVVAAAGSAVLAEVLVAQFRVYRFGVEEAAAVGAVVLVAFGIMLAGSSLPSTPNDFEVFLGLIAGSVAAFAVYLRFGYVYAAVAAMLLGSVAVFQLDLPAVAQRLLAVAVLGGFFAGARMKRREYGDEFPGDAYGAMQASAWLGMYAFLNLHLLFGFYSPALNTSFYRFTYAMIWMLPAIGLWLAIRDRDRLLLDASLVMALATLMTNKAYLGVARQTWDPVLFGLLLIGVALLLKRWLAAGAGGSRRGFTASRLLSSDREKLAMVGTASAAFQPGPATHAQPAPDDTFKGGGGRSGGAGAGGSF